MNLEANFFFIIWCNTKMSRKCSESNITLQHFFERFPKKHKKISRTHLGSTCMARMFMPGILLESSLTSSHFLQSCQITAQNYAPDMCIPPTNSNTKIAKFLLMTVELEVKKGDLAINRIKKQHVCFSFQGNSKPGRTKVTMALLCYYLRRWFSGLVKHF